MISLPKPAISHLALHNSCVATVTDEAARMRLGSLEELITPAQANYDGIAVVGELYTIEPKKYKPNDVVVAIATKSDLIGLYEDQLVPKNKPSHVHYSRLKSTPGFRCPYCLIGHASTLDHYLPKSRFPQYSVLPLNLVPACRDCQSQKGRSVAATGAAQTFHPYYESGEFFTDRWVHAEINQSVPVSATFAVIVPQGWSDLRASRAKNHFKAHNLSHRYSVEAATELAVLDLLYRPYRADGRSHMILPSLQERAVAHRGHQMNSWQTALYEGLVASNWYWA